MNFDDTLEGDEGGPIPTDYYGGGDNEFDPASKNNRNIKAGKLDQRQFRYDNPFKLDKRKYG